MHAVSRRGFLQGTAALAWAATYPLSATAKDQPVTEFTRYQTDRRAELWSLLGDLPKDHKPAPPKLIKTERGPGYTLEHLILDLNGLEPVPALLLIPDKRQPRAPGLVYIHAHGG